MPPIDLRDIVSRLFSQPQTMLPELGRTITYHAAQNWWVLGLGTLMFIILRAALRRSSRHLSEVRRTSNRKIERRHAKRSLASAITISVLWVSYVLFVLAQIGITISGFTASILLGALGIAGALVAQGLFKDLLAGYAILSEDQYGIGDFVDFGLGVSGIVQAIGLRTTKLRSADGTVYHVRHADFSKVGNRTQSSGALLLDVTMTAHDPKPVSPFELDLWSEAVVSSAKELRTTLNAVRSLVNEQPANDIDIRRVAEVVPTLVPNATEETMIDVRGAATDSVQRALLRAPAGTTPVFQEIEMLGLVDASETSVTVRLRVRLREQSSRTYAMQLLRRRIFDVLHGLHVVPSFAEAADDVIN